MKNWSFSKIKDMILPFLAIMVMLYGLRFCKDLIIDKLGLENFMNFGPNIHNDPKADYLYPSRDLYCENQGMSKSYMPQICCHENGCNYDQNCRCTNKKTGHCTECWPPTYIENDKNRLPPMPVW